MRFGIAFGCLLIQAGLVSADPWPEAEQNSRQTQRVIKFCNRYVQGWLDHADLQSGLLPRLVTDRKYAYWNAPDCAADNYPFIVLTAEVTDNYHLKRNVEHILAQEQKLCNRLDNLPDDYAFATGKFRTEKYDINQLIFGAVEYCKDGLMPISEWIGPSPWLERMEQLLHDIWKHAPFDSPVGKIPSDNLEVNGQTMQAMSRLYWMTGKKEYKEWCFRLADYYLEHKDLLAAEKLSLRDHGCEIVGGLSEVYVIAAREEPERHQRYQPKINAILDCILQHGLTEEGLMYDFINPQTGEHPKDRLTDSWGYVYNAFLTVAMIDDEDRYRQPVLHALTHLHKHQRDWDKTAGADECADFVEGAINLLNRLPVPSAFPWIDAQVEYLFKKQRHDGIIEGWYGDGNSARTLIMYAFMKTQGVRAAPWREDIRLGAVRDVQGAVHVLIESEFQWIGRLCFDRPRHRDYFHMPLDYPRINQFPEWFTVEADKSYEIRIADGPPRTVQGKELYDMKLILEGHEPVRLTVKPL